MRGWPTAGAGVHMAGTDPDTRPLSADDAETHMDPISATSSLLLLWYGVEFIYGSAEQSVLIQLLLLLLHHASQSCMHSDSKNEQ
jgi:hypothetical protein